MKLVPVLALPILRTIEVNVFAVPAVAVFSGGASAVRSGKGPAPIVKLTESTSVLEPLVQEMPKFKGFVKGPNVILLVPG